MTFRKKMSEIATADALEYTEHIINTIHNPLIILYGDMKVALANRAFYLAFKVPVKDTEEQFFYDLGDGQWDIPRLRQLLEDILPKEKSFDNFKVTHHFPGVGKRDMLLNACRFYMEANRTKLIIITFKDVTDHNIIALLRKEVARLKARLKQYAKDQE